MRPGTVAMKTGRMFQRSDKIDIMRGSLAAAIAAVAAAIAAMAAVVATAVGRSSVLLSMSMVMVLCWCILLLL